MLWLLLHNYKTPNHATDFNAKNLAARAAIVHAVWPKNVGLRWPFIGYTFYRLVYG